MRITIIPTKNENGKYILTEPDGTLAQEGYEYNSQEEALNAAEQIWPSNSTWDGEPVNGGWSIKID